MNFDTLRGLEMDDVGKPSHPTCAIVGFSNICELIKNKKMILSNWQF